MSLLLVGVVLLILIYLAVAVYFKVTMGVCRSKRVLHGRTVIVTGANTGIGLETARDLATRKARVILACRSLLRGQNAVDEIIRSTGNQNVVVKQLDTSSFQSVRNFANHILKNEKRLDILIHNAGIMSRPDSKKSVDGLEIVMATNHFGPFLLTHLLLPLLKQSAPSRIVIVSSIVHEYATMRFDDINLESSFDSYKKSKLANVWFTRVLSKKLKGTGVTVNALHPGVVDTQMARRMNVIMDWGLKSVLKPFVKSAKQGAETSIYLAVSEELEGVSGRYFSDCQEKKLKRCALDDNSAQRLWDYSLTVTNLNSFFNENDKSLYCL